MRKSHEDQLRSMTPAQLHEVADRLMEETAHRGLFVRLNAALIARSLRARALQSQEPHNVG